MKDEENPPGGLIDSFPRPSALISHPFPIAAILLAAGRSRRMGAFKPLLPFGAKTVVESCIDNLRGACVNEIVVVAGHLADELRAQLARSPVRFALNEEAESEMGASIARGIEQLSNEATAVLIALADHPAVSTETIKLLIETRARTGASFIVPQHGVRGGHPVLVDLKFRAELSRLGDGGLRALMQEHANEVLRVEVDCPFVARDMDTWDDYRALHLEVFNVPPPFERPDDGSD
ncbi:MAG: molybdenum cofactor cytidylyltransferase [Acidobacteriota bacterium]|nr:molybdenum cofactor cytidylyltransferase [Acidobacteriota bacterium]